MLAAGSAEAFASTDIMPDSAEASGADAFGKSQSQPSPGNSIMLAGISSEGLEEQSDAGGLESAAPAKVADFTSDTNNPSSQFEEIAGAAGAKQVFTTEGSPQVSAFSLEKNVDNDGDGKSELVIFYNYDNANTTLWQFDSTDTGFAAPQAVWSSGAGNWDWTRSKVVSADYNGDGKTELAVFYDYGWSNTGLWLFDPNGTGFAAPRQVWGSGAGNWEQARSKVAGADYNGNNRTEIAVYYDYGSANTGLWGFDPTDTGFVAPRLVWSSGAGNWEWGRSRANRADYNGDGRTELAILYNYSGANTGLWIFDPSDTGFVAPRQVWGSGAGNWEWLRTKITNGEHFKPRTSLVSVTLLEVNLSNQTLTVHGHLVIELEERFFMPAAGPYTSFLISSGKPSWETPTGLYSIHSKQLVTDMSSGAGWSEQYYVPGVPYVFWFIGTLYAVHGVYWLGPGDFGTPHSHGCVGVPESWGAWLYYWVPVGTPLLIHY